MTDRELGAPDPDAGWPQKLSAAIPVSSVDRTVTPDMYDAVQAMWHDMIDREGYEQAGLIAWEVVAGIDAPGHPHCGPDIVLISSLVSPKRRVDAECPVEDR